MRTINRNHVEFILWMRNGWMGDDDVVVAGGDVRLKWRCGVFVRLGEKNAIKAPHVTPNKPPDRPHTAHQLCYYPLLMGITCDVPMSRTNCVCFNRTVFKIGNKTIRIVAHQSQMLECDRSDSRLSEWQEMHLVKWVLPDGDSGPHYSPFTAWAIARNEMSQWPSAKWSHTCRQQRMTSSLQRYAFRTRIRFASLQKGCKFGADCICMHFMHCLGVGRMNGCASAAIKSAIAGQMRNEEWQHQHTDTHTDIYIILNWTIWMVRSGEWRPPLAPSLIHSACPRGNNKLLENCLHFPLLMHCSRVHGRHISQIMCHPMIAMMMMLIAI